MSTAANSGARIKRVEVTDERITAHLADGRVISVPLAWSWRLAAASPAQRAKYEIIGDGQGVHWPEVDDDVSAEGSPALQRARRSRSATRLDGAGYHESKVGHEVQDRTSQDR
ncbi:MAG: DUF2442 domain-containing protein [Candidatus Rokuibacteriota bacterium]|nr:MAG: DUF2442 domain-containing protein [Candidatus Rokubacteria bacterium]